MEDRTFDFRTLKLEFYWKSVTSLSRLEPSKGVLCSLDPFKILFFLPCSPFRPTLLSKCPLAYVVEIHVPLRPQVNYRVPFNKFHFPVDFAAKFPLVVDIPFFLQVKFQKYIFFLGNKMIMFSCSPKPLEILTFVENSFLYFWDHIMHQCLFLPITWSLFKWFYSPNTIERNPSNCVWFWVWLPNSL